MTKLLWFFELSAAVLIFTISAAPSLANANSAEVCNDLYRLSCAPGTYNDGTGAARNGTVESNATDDAKKKALSLANTKFSAALLKPTNSYFRKAVLSATGLSLNPTCDGAETKPSSACLKLMVEGTTNVLANQHFPDLKNIGMNTAADIEDLTYLIASPQYKDVQSQILEQLKDSFNKDVKPVQQKVFPAVQGLLIRKIEATIANETLRKNLIDKIKSIRFDGTDCSKVAGQSAEMIPELLTVNAFYNPSSNTFRYCSGSNIDNKSEFAMAAIVAHELAHSIDPCGIKNGPRDYSFKFQPNLTREQAEDAYPFSKVVQCLRSEKSVRAKTFATTLKPGAARVGIAPYDIGGGLTGGMGGGLGFAIPAFKDFCSGDQITESFADWMSNEIVPEYIEKSFPKLTTQQMRNGYSNIWRGTCRNFTDPTNNDVHPTIEARANRLILVQPKVREQMGCPKTPSNGIYCPVAGAPELNPTSGAGVKPPLTNITLPAKAVH